MNVKEVLTSIGSFMTVVGLIGMCVLTIGLFLPGKLPKGESEETLYFLNNGLVTGVWRHNLLTKTGGTLFFVGLSVAFMCWFVID